jgi:hypothetical protein
MHPYWVIVCSGGSSQPTNNGNNCSHARQSLCEPAVAAAAGIFVSEKSKEEHENNGSGAW